ncbi:HesA/MoeB/ThiF family protein [archaeon]|jgi:molybdopterin/thiamine biosynthesis adenylyltransferase|nr:HesA/MoeB/ThiF family protein [archaeon]
MDLSRQELVIGKDAQKKLENAKIAIVGIGALGSLTAELLVRSGVKHLILIDRDFIEGSNLQRQHMFLASDIGKPKVEVAKKFLNGINKKAKVKCYFDNLDHKNIDIIDSDLVLDCTDNMQTRFLVNDYCKKNKIKWIFSSAIKGQGYVYNVSPKGPCFNCIFESLQSPGTCESFGVLNTVTSMISSIQVNEAIKIIINKNPEKDLIYLDVDKNDILKIKVNNKNSCSVCSGEYKRLNGGGDLHAVNLCMGSSYLFDKPKKVKKRNFIGAKKFGKVFKYKEMTVFKDKILIKAKSEREAKNLYSKYIGN